MLNYCCKIACVTGVKYLTQRSHADLFVLGRQGARYHGYGEPEKLRCWNSRATEPLAAWGI